jgi:hypothetical protein
MTKTFFTRYFIETPNSFSNRKDIMNNHFSSLRVNWTDSNIIFYDNRYGLRVDTYTEATSKEEAKSKTKNLVENILSIIDLTNSSGSNPATFVSIYDATDNLTEREYEQIFHIPLHERNIRVTDIQSLLKILRVFGDVFGKNEQRIIRAIFWFRKGLFEKNVVDKFISFWTGLESINELLCNYFGLTEDERKWKCNICHSVILPVSTIGIKKLFIDILKFDNDNFQKIRNARNDLIHGGSPLNTDFVKEIMDYNPIIKKALIIGIGELLQIDNKIINKIIKYTPIKYIDSFRIILKLNLLGLEIPKIEEVDSQPIVDLDYDILKPEINDEGKLDIKGKVLFKFKNLKFDNGIYEVRADDFSSIQKIKLDFKNQEIRHI